MIGKSVELALTESESASAVGAVKKISFTRQHAALFKSQASKAPDNHESLLVNSRML